MATVVFLTACVGLSAYTVLVEIPRGWWFVCLFISYSRNEALAAFLDDFSVAQHCRIGMGGQPLCVLHAFDGHLFLSLISNIPQ